MTRERMKEEGLERMKKLNILATAIEEFKKEDKLYKTEGQKGVLYDLDDEEKKAVEKVEKEWNGVVYHVIKSFTEFGTLLNMLYVSQYDEEWEMDRENLKEMIVFAYVKNLDSDQCSEFGSIGVKPMIGGVVRIG